MKRLLTIGIITLSFALPPVFAQDQQQQQQQQEIDPAAAEAAMQAASAALEAAAAERAALEAQQQQMAEQPGNGEPATQPVAAAEEQPEATAQPNGPTSRPTQQQQRNRFKRRTTTQPAVAHRPSPPRPPRTVNTDFAMLLTRSIFKKGPQQIVDPGAPGSAPATRPAEVVAPEHNLVFNGVTEADAATALVEDTAGHKVNKLHVGDAIASGKVTGIDFDSLEYTVNGKARRIEIGQNLEGTVAAPTSGPAVFGASGGTSSGDSGTSGGASNSILEKMRQRRMQGK